MKTCLGGLQDALMKCRANILSHEMLESSTLGGQGGHTKSAQVLNDNTMELVALQAQLEVCKNDLAEQRAAYQELLIEKNRITGEMQTLLQKNHQLSMNHAQNRFVVCGCFNSLAAVKTTSFLSLQQRNYGHPPAQGSRHAGGQHETVRHLARGL